jgi:hypothetical protein
LFEGTIETIAVIVSAWLRTTIIIIEVLFEPQQSLEDSARFVTIFGLLNNLQSKGVSPASNSQSEGPGVSTYVSQ